MPNPVIDLRRTRRRRTESAVLTSMAWMLVSVCSGCSVLETIVERGERKSAVKCATCAVPAPLPQSATASVAPPPAPAAGDLVDAQDWNTLSSGPPHGSVPSACQPLSNVPPAPEPIPDPVAEANARCEARLAEMQQKIEELVRGQEEANQARDLTMQAFNRDLQRLSDEVTYWKEEVRQRDQASAAQHAKDMQSLDALIDLVEQIPVAGSASAPAEQPSTDQ